MKKVLPFIFLAVLSRSAFALNYFDKNETCLKVSDIAQIASHFQQFQTFTQGQGQAVICKNQGIDDKWFDVVRIVLAMRQLTVMDKLPKDAGDDLTLKPVSQKDWWRYFTESTNRFEIEPSYCNSNSSIGAFVNTSIRGKINLCKPFFKADTMGQIEVMMHEARHFDGFGHVSCTQGFEEGSYDACDVSIKTGGSYAVGVQVLVELSLVPQINKEDRLMAEHMALYQVNNKFNSLPTVKASNYIYLSNEAGEIHRAPVSNLGYTEFVAQMTAPAKIYSYGSSYLNIFPIDSRISAYRTSKDYKIQSKTIGSFAVHYNNESEFERSRYQVASYHGIGAIIKDDTIYFICGNSGFPLCSFRFPGGRVQSLLNLKLDSNVDSLYVLSESGNVYDLKYNYGGDSIISNRTNLFLPRNTVSGFSVERDEAYALTDGGELLHVDLKKGLVSQTALPKAAWISATPFVLYNVFEKNVD